MHSAIFLINLMQDVNIVRPLVYLAARDLRLDTHVLVTKEFTKRDKAGVWMQELREISQATGAPVAVLDATRDELRLAPEYKPGQPVVIFKVGQPTPPTAEPVPATRSGSAAASKGARRRTSIPCAVQSRKYRLFPWGTAPATARRP